MTGSDASSKQKKSEEGPARIAAHGEWLVEPHAQTFNNPERVEISVPRLECRSHILSNIM